MATEEDREKSKKIASKLLPHVVPLFLLPSRKAKPSDVICSGSGALVDTGTRKILITCEHVWATFIDHREKHPASVICMSTGQSIHEINDLPLLSINKEQDVAILDLADGQILKNSTKEFCTTDSWPPPRPKVGEVLVAIGFPRSFQTAINAKDKLQFQTLHIVDEIVSISDRHIALADQDQVRESISHAEDDITENISLGGISGCPAFVYRENRLDLAGVVYEAEETGSGILFATHADYITSTGQIDSSRIPLW